MSRPIRPEYLVCRCLQEGAGALVINWKPLYKGMLQSLSNHSMMLCDIPLSCRIAYVEKKQAYALISV